MLYLVCTPLLTFVHVSGSAGWSIRLKTHAWQSYEPRSAAGHAPAQVEIKVTAIRCISRAEMLPFDLADAARSETELAANPGAVVVLQARRACMAVTAHAAALPIF